MIDFLLIFYNFFSLFHKKFEIYKKNYMFSILVILIEYFDI